MASLAKACTAASYDTIVKHRGHQKPHQEARGSTCLPSGPKGMPIWCHLDGIPQLVRYIKVFSVFSKREASCLYSPSFLKEFFSETQFPAKRVLGNSPAYTRIL